MERFDGRTIEGDRIAVLGVDHEAEIDQRSFPLTEPSPTDATYQQMQQRDVDDSSKLLP